MVVFVAEFWVEGLPVIRDDEPFVAELAGDVEALGDDEEPRESEGEVPLHVVNSLACAFISVNDH
jgi:hypothetical protein